MTIKIIESVDKVCDYCRKIVRIGFPTKIWTEVDGVFYHNRCIKFAMEEAVKYQKIEEIISSTFGNSVMIIDVWDCSLCGGYSGGYGREKCIHCGAKAHYGSNNGSYTQSNKVF